MPLERFREWQRRLALHWQLLHTSKHAMSLDQPLSDREFNELDAFLLSDRCGDDAMTMDSLHGFLTALVVGPEEVPLAEWLPHVWGESPEQAPEFKSDKEFQRITGLIARFMNEIAITLEVAPKEFEPLFCEHEWQGRPVLDAEAWAWGFWEGMQLRDAAWEPAWHADIAPLLRPIYLLGAEEIEEEEMALVDDPAKRHKLAIEIEAAIPQIYRYWLQQRKSALTPVLRSTPKVGRNAPCPCGSGKKYKLCCGKGQPAQQSDQERK